MIIGGGGGAGLGGGLASGEKVVVACRDGATLTSLGLGVHVMKNIGTNPEEVSVGRTSDDSSSGARLYCFECHLDEWI